MGMPGGTNAAAKASAAARTSTRSTSSQSSSPAVSRPSSPPLSVAGKPVQGPRPTVGGRPVQGPMPMANPTPVTPPTPMAMSPGVRPTPNHGTIYTGGTPTLGYGRPGVTPLAGLKYQKPTRVTYFGGTPTAGYRPGTGATSNVSAYKGAPKRNAYSGGTPTAPEGYSKRIPASPMAAGSQQFRSFGQPMQSAGSPMVRPPSAGPTLGRTSPVTQTSTGPVSVQPVRSPQPVRSVQFNAIPQQVQNKVQAMGASGTGSVSPSPTQQALGPTGGLMPWIH